MAMLCELRVDAGIHPRADDALQLWLVADETSKPLTMFQVEVEEPDGGRLEQPLTEHQPLGVVYAIHLTGHPARHLERWVASKRTKDVAYRTNRSPSNLALSPSTGSISGSLIVGQISRVLKAEIDASRRIK